MLLIRETGEEAFARDVEYIAEASASGKKTHCIKGIFLQSEVTNRNGRRYPRQIMEREVQRYIKDHVNENRAYGELGHPQGPIINGPLISHRIVELKQDGDNFIGKARILDTHNGRIVKELLDDGGKLGVSSRGMGSLKPVGGVNEVQDDFYLATAGDIVFDPSAPDAFVQGIMEGVDWILEGGAWVPKFVDLAAKRIQSTPKSKLDSTKVQIFETFMSNLSKNL